MLSEIPPDDKLPPLAVEQAGDGSSVDTGEPGGVAGQPPDFAKAIRRALAFKNAKASDNERNFSDILASLPLVQRGTFGRGSSEVRARLLENPEGSADIMPDNSFIPQPFGTQKSPDFVAKVGGQVFCVEMKSSKGGAPVFNSGLPESDIICLFTSGKHNKTMCFMGRDVLPRDLYAKMAQAREDCTALVDDQYNTAMLNDPRNKLKLTFYVRPMHNANVDVFRDLDIGGLEEKVFAYIRQRHGQ